MPRRYQIRVRHRDGAFQPLHSLRQLRRRRAQSSDQRPQLHQLALQADVLRRLGCEKLLRLRRQPLEPGSSGARVGVRHSGSEHPLQRGRPAASGCPA